MRARAGAPHQLEREIGIALVGSEEVGIDQAEAVGQTLQRLAGENDARAHRSQAVRNYGRSVKEHGLKETLRKRDEPFGEGFAWVGEPEGRSAVVRAARER